MKIYIQPRTEVHFAESIRPMAVSIIEGSNADDSQILTKENISWDMWEDE